MLPDNEGQGRDYLSVQQMGNQDTWRGRGFQRDQWKVITDEARIKAGMMNEAR